MTFAMIMTSPHIIASCIFLYNKMLPHSIKHVLVALRFLLSPSTVYFRLVSERSIWSTSNELVAVERSVCRHRECSVNGWPQSLKVYIVWVRNRLCYKMLWRSSWNLLKIELLDYFECVFWCLVFVLVQFLYWEILWQREPGGMGFFY